MVQVTPVARTQTQLRTLPWPRNVWRAAGPTTIDSMTPIPTRLRCHAVLLAVIALLLFGSIASARAESRYFRSSDGVRLHYLEVGQGQTIVFVPGWTMPAKIWEPQIRHFANSYRVIAFDPRGQGESEIARDGYTIDRRARDIAELLEQVGAPVVLVGWSLGVLESLEYVNLVGTDRLMGLVLVDNSIGEEPPPVSDPTFLKRLRENRTATTERFVRGMFRTPQSDMFLRQLMTSARGMPLEASVALLSYPYPRQHWKELAYRTDKPVLYVVSERFRGQAENFKKNRPEGHIEIFEKAGHALFVDEAERFNQVLGDFLVNDVRPPITENNKSKTQ